MIPHPASIAFAAITQYPAWYRGKLRSIKHTDKIRGDLALEFFRKAVSVGYRMVVLDGSSAKRFVQEAQVLPGIHLAKRRSLKRSPSKRQALRLASGLEGVLVIIGTEAEKVSLVTDGTDQIVRPIIAGEADIVVPKRDPALFRATYPAYQYESEMEGNRLYNEQLRLSGILPPRHEDLDVFFGPRAFRNDRRIVSLLLRRYSFHIDHHHLPLGYFDPEELSDAGLFPLVMALKKQMQIKSVTIPFRYPPLQKENEEIGARELFMEKRRSQRLVLLVELMHFLGSLSKR